MLGTAERVRDVVRGLCKTQFAVVVTANSVATTRVVCVCALLIAFGACSPAKPARKPVVSKRLVMRDWIECPITLRRGLTGAKPEKVCHWAFEVVGAHPDDQLVDLFPGTGAVTEAWRTWRGLFTLPAKESA